MTDAALTSKEQYKLDVLTKVINKEIKPGQAAMMLGISPRQVRRLKIAVLDNGTQAVIHKLKGKLGNHHIDAALKEKVLTVIRETYSDFKPRFAAEKLEDQYNVSITSQTIRVWMSEQGLWKIRKQRQVSYHAWRPRKEYFGELQQFDGSYHYWFENRFVDDDGTPTEVCLLASIDDATGKITKASFAANEGIVAVFTFWRQYIETIGKPLAVYLDKFSTYKINHKSAVDNQELITQFQRAMRTLTIALITAYSPQAKGRIERLFETLQDRLVKEMRLAGINNPKEGNIFLEEVFLQKFNDKFAVVPTKDGDVHKPLSKDDKKYLNRTFSVQSIRRVNNDFTIQFKNHWYQLVELQKTTVKTRDTILVEVWFDETIHLSLRGIYLVYSVLPERPRKIKKQPTILTTHRINWIPPQNHPWRKPFKHQQ